jgi:hypothetical protein
MDDRSCGCNGVEISVSCRRLRLLTGDCVDGEGATSARASPNGGRCIANNRAILIIL